MGEAVLDKADCAGADSSARRPQQGHQHLDRRPLARPVLVRQPGQVTSTDAATRVPHRDRLGRAQTGSPRARCRAGTSAGAVLARGPAVGSGRRFRAPQRARLAPPRWQDIEDLLAAGIDVISTVSVGHLDNYSAWSTVTLNERIAALAAEATAILAGCLLWLRLLSAAERLGFSYR
jgi:hypothetical protein